MLQSFKCVIFFGSKFWQKDQVINAYRDYPNVRVFEIYDYDELDQILRQSESSVVLIRQIQDAHILSAIDMASKGELRFKTLFLDESRELPDDQISLLSQKRVSTFFSNAVDPLIERISFLLLGKVRLSARKLDSGIGDFERGRLKKSYFSHYQLVDGVWQLVVSSHEKDPDIETVFGLSWSLWSQQLIERAGKINSPEEIENFSDHFWGVIYPHEGRTAKSLSVIHLKIDPLGFEDKRNKAYLFLKQIDQEAESSGE